MQHSVYKKYFNSKIVSNLILITLAVIFITGCSNVRIRAPYVATTTMHAGGGVILVVGSLGTVGAIGTGPGAIVGGVVGSVVGYDLQKKESVILQKIDKLNSYGIDSEFYGKQVKFILAADGFFYSGSSTLKGSGSKAMKLLAEIIHYFPVTTIEVVGFIRGREGDLLECNRALGYTRAQTIMKYLQTIGVAPNLIIANPERSNCIMFKNNNKSENFLYSDSDRIEIILNPVSYYE